MDLRWLARELNQPADDLTNMKFGAFNPSLRIHFTWKEIKFKILHLLSDEALGFAELLSSIKESGLPASASSDTVAKKGDKLRARDPW